MKRILIVDDELSITNFLVDIVQILGHETRVLTSGKKVLSVAKEWKPDLITLDIMMPSPDGLEVLTQLKGDPETRSIPVFVVSIVAKNDEIAPQIAQARWIFNKPIDTREFIEQLQKATQSPSGPSL